MKNRNEWGKAVLSGGVIAVAVASAFIGFERFAYAGSLGAKKSKATAECVFPECSGACEEDSGGNSTSSGTKCRPSYTENYCGCTT